MKEHHRKCIAIDLASGVTDQPGEKKQELSLLSSPSPHVYVNYIEAAMETGWWAEEDEPARWRSSLPAKSEDGISLSWVPMYLIAMHSKAFEETLKIVTVCPQADTTI